MNRTSFHGLVLHRAQHFAAYHKLCACFNESDSYSEGIPYLDIWALYFKIYVKDVSTTDNALQKSIIDFFFSFISQLNIAEHLKSPSDKFLNLCAPVDPTVT